MKSVSFDSTENIFIIEKKDQKIKIDFPLKVNPKWQNYETNDFQYNLLYNPYFEIQDDIFTIKLDDSDERKGYLFHLSLFYSDDEWSQYGLLNEYVFIAFKWYLETHLEEIDDYFIDKLKSVENENLFILVINPYPGPKIDLMAYELELLSLGFSYLPNNHKISGFDFKSLLNGKTITLRKKNKLLSDDSFIELIIKNKLPETKESELRFFLCYQIIEYLIRQESTNDREIIENMIKHKYDFNSLKEAINNYQNERETIREIFEKYKMKDRTKIECYKNTYNHSGLFLAYNQTNDSDIFYNFRNKFIHYYESFTGKESEFSQLCFYSEQIVYELLKAKYS
ncbi:hypothetical protein [Treponema sp.]|uniref:hypothetical protein n=1 Tax=Treponema sp. TaxID=166 RepID=UPI00298DDE6B|nr:hypothetical protein [Treponema sp.]